MNPESKEANWVHGILVIMAAVMPVMAIVTLIPVLPMLEKEFAHVTGSEYLVPAALTIPAFCLAVFSPAAGWLADKIGRKNLLASSLFFYAALGVLPYLLTDLKQIIAARFALGIVEAAIMTVATTLIGDYFTGSRRERWLGIQVATISVAAVVLVWMGGMLGQTLGSRGPFLLYLVGLPLALLCFFVLFEPLTNTHKTDEQKQPLPLTRLAPLIAGGFIFGILFYIVAIKLGNILALKTSVTPQFVGQMSAIINFAMIIGSLFFGFLKNRLSAPFIITLSMVLIAIGYALIPQTTSVASTVAACAMVTFAAGMMLPTFLTWVMSFLSLQVRGRGTGLWQGAFFMGQFIAPIFAVVLSKQLGGLENIFIVIAGIAVLFAAVSAFNIKNSLALTQLEKQVA